MIQNSVRLRLRPSKTVQESLNPKHCIIYAINNTTKWHK